MFRPFLLVALNTILLVFCIFYIISKTNAELPSAEVLKERFTDVGGITRSLHPLVKVQDIVYVILERTEDRFNTTSDFFTDFGLSLLPSLTAASSVFFRGYGPQHHAVEIRRGLTNQYLGVGMLVEKREDLQALAGLGRVVVASEASGGGDVVVLHDPAGFIVEVRLASEWSPSPLRPLSPPTQTNLPRQQRRPVNSLHRPAPGPPEVEKLAHCATQVRSIIPTVQWYVETLGLIVSDMQFLAPFGASSDNPAFSIPSVAFLRLDKGSEGSPHHAMALVSAASIGFEHCAFEVTDVDAIGKGQRWLEISAVKGASYTHAWGIGRHVLGSNFFDYWREGGADEMFEHTADIDLLDSEVPTGFGLMTPSSQHLFGPEMPTAFVRPLNLVKSAISRLCSAFITTGSFQDGDLSLPRIAGLVHAVSPLMAFKEYEL